MNLAEPVVKEVVINAPVSKVWKAITEKEQVAKWFMPQDGFELKVGNVFHMVGHNKGKEYPHTCKIVDIVPEKKLSYTWHLDEYEGETLVTFELQEEDDKTKLTLTHSGFEKLPYQPEDAGRDDYNKGWHDIIGKYLKEYVENQNA